MPLEPLLAHHLQRRSELIDRIESLVPQIAAAAEDMATRLINGNTLFACGNGGSASQAQHFVTELVGRFKSDRKPLPAVALTADGSVLTCIANDFGADQVFSRQVEGLMRPGDLLVGFSTSGHSENVIRAIEAANRLGNDSLALLGRDGGACKTLATRSIVVDLNETDVIQEGHLAVLHLLCEGIEARLKAQEAGSGRS